LHAHPVTAGKSDCMDSWQTVDNRHWPVFPGTSVKQQDRQVVPTNSSRSCLDNSLEIALHEARVRNLEASLSAEQADNAEQIEQLKASVQALRAEVVALKRQLADGAVALALQDKTITTRDASIASLRVEMEKWRQQADAQRKANMRLQAQLAKLVEMVRQNQSDADAANAEKDRQLEPLSQQIEALNRVISVKQRHEELVMQDLEASKRRCFALQADAATLRELVEQTRAEHQFEMQQLQEDAAAQSPCERQEELLRARCRLLQAWCVRSSRSLDWADEPWDFQQRQQQQQQQQQQHREVQQEEQQDDWQEVRDEERAPRLQWFNDHMPFDRLQSFLLLQVVIFHWCWETADSRQTRHQ